VPRQTAAGKQMALGRSTLPLQLQSMPCWSNGIVKKTEKMGISLTTRHYKARSSFGGIAKNVQMARYIAGRLEQTNGLLAKGQQDAPFVMAKCFVSANLWKLFVLMLLLTLTVKQMVSVLLK